MHPWADVVLAEPEHHAGVMAAAGQLWATLTDLGRFAAFLLGDTADVLAPATLEEMTVPAGVDCLGAPDWSAYGLGLQVLRVDGRTLVGHGGSMPGFLAGVFVDREEQTGAVSLANTTTGVDPLVFGLLADLRAAEPRIVEPWTPSPSPVPLERLGSGSGAPAPYALRAVGAGCCTWGRCPAGRAGQPVRPRDGTLDGAGRLLRRRDAADRRDHLDLDTSSSPARPTTRRARPGRRDEAGWR